MALKFTAAQRVAIRRATKPAPPDPARGELNVVPFLDIVMNVLMFVLATSATVFTATLPLPARGCCASGGGVTR